ncbi:MAG: N-acetylmuramoyl-L-alanine amidase [Zoogloeaceae bacterium]|jgi:N-acetylmuramoyl-L-alanine amidase|nr:N-acetylmuramoyl-L-alanine amidase [Zoogloeaceae bacterium]
MQNMTKKFHPGVARFVATRLALAWVLMLGALSAQAAHIVVDTGHTPQLPGAMGASGRAEYLYNLDFSAAVSRDLVALNNRVTRVSADGKEIRLTQRPAQAPDADFFISIHHDSMQQAWIDAGRQTEFSGFSLFISRRNPHYAQSLRCARAIGEKLLAAGEKPSLYHATPIRGENRPLIDNRLGVHRFDELIVLKYATMPAVLVEIGVIVNPDEEKRLGEPDTITRLAAAISQAVHDCNVKP